MYRDHFKMETGTGTALECETAMETSTTKGNLGYSSANPKNIYSDNYAFRTV